MRVGFVGVGNMGGAMAANVLAAGHDVTVCDPSADAVRPLVERGAWVGSTPADAAAGSRRGVDRRDGRRAGRGGDDGPDGVLAGAAAGAVVAVHSTVHPRSVQRRGRRRARGVHVLDAPISGGVQGARAATLCLMVGGDADAFDRGAAGVRRRWATSCSTSARSAPASAPSSPATSSATSRCSARAEGNGRWPRPRASTSTRCTGSKSTPARSAR